MPLAAAGPGAAETDAGRGAGAGLNGSGLEGSAVAADIGGALIAAKPSLNEMRGENDISTSTVSGPQSGEKIVEMRCQQTRALQHGCLRTAQHQRYAEHDPWQEYRLKRHNEQRDLFALIVLSKGVGDAQNESCRQSCPSLMKDTPCVNMIPPRHKPAIALD